MRNLVTIALFLSLFACGGGGGDESSPSQPQNPSVEVELSQTARKGQPVTLRAKASGVGTINKIEWRQVAGPIISFEQTDSLELPITPASNAELAADSYTFEVAITNDQQQVTRQQLSFEVKRAMSSAQAARLLHQATLGPKGSEITHATGVSEEEWLSEQMQLPITEHLPLVQNYPDRDEPNQINRIDAWWKASLNAPDQLRQRVAFALSEILVVSDSNNALRGEPEGMAQYQDILLKHAFGNYRELLEEVTLSPVMGTYLSHLGNEKADEALNIRPDENYAREVMQLFTIGLAELNQDGSPKLDGEGNTIATYGQDQIEGFARVFTGWTFGASARWKRPSRNFTIPMEAYSDYHSEKEKVLLNGEVLAGGQSAEDDLSAALDNLFNHANVGPFIGKQLIQRLVTSNPTPQYVERIANVFDDNGSGVRGDLGAVVSAILLDEEARQTSGVLNYYGKVREPLLRTVQFWRELDANSPANLYFTWSLNDSHGQTPLGSPSVFNFFRPDYQPADLLELGIVAPELQIANDAALIGQFNNQYSNFLWNIKEVITEPSDKRILLSMQNHADILELQGLEALLDYYDTLFYSGSMSTAQRHTLREVQDIYADWGLYHQVALLLFTVSVSPDYVIQL
ncbi:MULTISPECIES: DUF1800 domain-containing protein [unclassified Agarivorans]|uniref:DUF1800 domain-containing protein n=1 Tax=unclassified Agarivorans TaxID=2636026 RepID=UPI0026E401F9|nr:MULTISPECIES: DUF1800 domain-containing protein [unclassified Agarivorans]MDO6684499.1 DUF1800 domain-containing protein [Agarivorans sp. 3_MG-2023]MDO6714664.1 DUF1800 domain-containing protein [Agarivorans sp. 2_MG-2023]